MCLRFLLPETGLRTVAAASGIISTEKTLRTAVPRSKQALWRVGVPAVVTVAGTQQERCVPLT